jgi:hypothetical protein
VCKPKQKRNLYDPEKDAVTGAIAKAEPITEGDDLTHAKSQKAAMDKAKGGAGGTLVVSVVLDLKGNRPVASIVLLKGGQLSTVSEPLG